MQILGVVIGFAHARRKGAGNVFEHNHQGIERAAGSGGIPCGAAVMLGLWFALALLATMPLASTNAKPIQRQGSARNLPTDYAAAGEGNLYDPMPEEEQLLDKVLQPWQRHQTHSRLSHPGST